MRLPWNTTNSRWLEGCRGSITNEWCGVEGETPGMSLSSRHLDGSAAAALPDCTPANMPATWQIAEVSSGLLYCSSFIFQENIKDIVYAFHQHVWATNKEQAHFHGIKYASSVYYLDEIMICCIDSMLLWDWHEWKYENFDIFFLSKTSRHEHSNH